MRFSIIFIISTKCTVNLPMEHPDMELPHQPTILPHLPLPKAL
jgi:hypothetical protein